MASSESIEATPVVLIHGFGANTNHWRFNQSVLAEQAHTYAIDLLGFGFSDQPRARLKGEASRSDSVHYCFEYFIMRNIADKHFRVISTALLSALLRLHTRPINQVVFLDSQGKSYLRNRLALRCFQRLSVPCLATRRYC